VKDCVDVLLVYYLIMVTYQDSIGVVNREELINYTEELSSLVFALYHFQHLYSIPFMSCCFVNNTMLLTCLC
jgi:hypothetical protein